MISFHGDEESLCNGLIILNIRVENASCFGGEHFLFGLLKIYNLQLEYQFFIAEIHGCFISARGKMQSTF